MRSSRKRSSVVGSGVQSHSKGVPRLQMVGDMQMSASELMFRASLQTAMNELSNAAITKACSPDERQQIGRIEDELAGLYTEHLRRFKENQDAPCNNTGK
jgi:hypothetical protein